MGWLLGEKQKKKKENENRDFEENKMFLWREIPQLGKSLTSSAILRGELASLGNEKRRRAGVAEEQSRGRASCARGAEHAPPCRSLRTPRKC